MSSQLTRSQILHQADFTIPVEIEGNYHNVYVIKRPGVDQFMKRVGELYEVVVFTASVSKVSPDMDPVFWSCVSNLFLTVGLLHSMVTRCWTNSTSTRWCTTDYSAKAATTTRATTSRISPKSDGI